MSITPRITEGMTSSRLIMDLRKASNRAAQTEAQISSGRQLLDAAVDPLAAHRSLRMRQELSQSESLRDNISQAQGWMQTTDGALSTMNDIVHRAREIAIAGGSDALQPSDRQALAQEVDNLIKSAKLAGNTRFNDSYVFGGQVTNTQPYNPNGADAYAGDTNGIVRQIGPGVSMQINVTGSAILGDGTDGKLLDTLRDLQTALNTGTTTDLNNLRSSILTSLDSNLGDVLGARSTIGTGLTRLEFAGGRLDDQLLAVKDYLSKTEDTDMAEAVIKLKTDQSIYQAAISTGASIIKPSLMDFLQ